MPPMIENASVDLAHLSREVARRRTFAIISHPDAGKTTLTEKLLLYEREAQGQYRAPMDLSELDDPAA